MTRKFEEKLKSNKPVLIAFLHAGRQDAVDVKYLLESLSKKYGDKMTFIKVDGSYDEHLARKYKIDTYPTWILIKENQELWRDSGTKKLEAIDESINGFV